MPPRPRSHQLEDASKSAFKMLLPPQWVVRDKTHDYGIDQEVEIFSESGESTGLIFLVQLRATDDPARALHAELDLTQLSYFNSLDLPTAVFRYFSGDGSFHWKWQFNINLDRTIDEQKTLRVKFAENEMWRVGDAEQMRRTLETIRNLRRHASSRRLFLKTVCSDPDASALYTIERAVHKIVQAVLTLAHAPAAGTEEITVLLEFERNQLKLKIDHVSSLTFDDVDLDDGVLCANITYGLCLLFSRHRLTRHALDAVTALIREGYATNSRFLAMEACMLLTGDLHASANLAVLNGLHQQHDEIYAKYLIFLRRTPYDETRKTEAMAIFLRAAAAAGRSSGRATTEAAALYSLGNVYRRNGPFALAVSYYNKARKLHPAYQDTEYFCAELAGCLYLCRRYRCAAFGYERAVANKPTNHLNTCLGDALLFSGRLKDARDRFTAASKSESAHISSDAELKRWLCDWLMNAYQTEYIVRKQSVARCGAEAIGPATNAPNADFLKILASDPLDEFANYHLGVNEATAGDHERAYARFLLCAFAVPNDLSSWTNAIVCSMNLNDHDFLLPTMMCAISANEREGYEAFRAHMESAGASAEALALFDQVGRELINVTRADHSEPFEIRIIGSNWKTSMPL